MIIASNDSASIFADGKLKPGIYKIQNVKGHTCLDIRETGELCCRPATVLGTKGLVRWFSPILRPDGLINGHFQWEISPLGPGYSIRRVQ